MNTLTIAFTIDWIRAIGWMLLHSLWQASIIFLLVMVVLRLMPELRSAMRYAIASGGLLLTTAISVATFVHLAGTSASVATMSSAPAIHHALNFSGAARESGLYPFIISLLEQNMSLVVLLWAIGFMAFAMRWVMGLYHSYRIRCSAQLLKGPWLDYVQRTASALAVRRPVKIAESVAISAPMVLGYLKPLILIPAGMIAGLSTQQLETIFLHELAHIRRNDYLMNVFQTIVESIFFFNPFLRMLSNEVRREREYCCDDIVVSMHGNNSAYAHALLRLAEAKLSAPAFALPLTGDRNQLFARIRRIMERSAKHSSVKSRLFIPLLLAAGALASISWMSADRSHENENVVLSKADTVPDKNKDGKRARFSRKSIITIDENGQPHEEVIQEFEGDESLRALLENNMSIFDDSAFANGFHGFTPGEFHGGMAPLWSDTIPPFDENGWQEFADSFHDRFRERFEDLFQGHADPRNFMEEFEKSFGWGQWTTPFKSLPPDSLDKFHHEDVFRNFREQFEKFRELAPDDHEDFKKNFRLFDNPIQHYERALREQLIEDRYLASGESIETLEWSDDSFKVNGKSLKPEDVKKYNDLRKGILESDASDKKE